MALRTFRLLNDEKACTEPGLPDPGQGAIRSFAYLEEEEKLCKMFAYCMDMDREAQRRNGLEGVGDTLLGRYALPSLFRLSVITTAITATTVLTQPSLHPLSLCTHTLTYAA